MKRFGTVTSNDTESLAQTYQTVTFAFAKVERQSCLSPPLTSSLRKKPNTPKPHLKLQVKGKIQSEEESCYTVFPVTIAKLHWGETNEDDWSSRHSAVNE